MDASIIYKIQALIHQYSQEGIVLWIDIYEGFLQYSVRINHLNDDDDVSWCGTRNISFTTINDMSDDDIIENIHHFVEEAKKQIKEEK